MTVGIRAAICLFIVLTVSHCLFPNPHFQQFEKDNMVELPQGSCFTFELNLSNEVESYTINPQEGHFKTIMNRISVQGHCEKSTANTKPVQIFFKHDSEIPKEGYRIKTTAEQVDIEVSSYSGYVYALETFSQMVEGGRKYPIGIVEDQPQVEHRGIMIDSVRHFLSMGAIRRLIKSMPMSKLNILHWHLADD